MKRKTFVVSLGGSIVYQEGINLPYVRKFTAVVKREVCKGNRFVIIMGGGRLARNFQQAAKKLGVHSSDALDTLGIAATRLNAQLIRTVFGTLAHPDILLSPDDVRLSGKYPVVVGGGWKPGNSTDLVAATIAVKLRSPLMINLGKPEYVYTKDIEKYPEAKPLPLLTWREYFDLVPGAWTPGMHAPIDPLAARLMARRGVAAIIAGGSNIGNIADIFAGKKYKGTLIKG